MSGTWTWAAATSTGTSHSTQDLPCQDAIDCALWQCSGEPPLLIAALADGAGSARYAEVGAVRATCAFVESVLQAFDEGGQFGGAGDILRSAVRDARRSVESAAAELGVAIDELASTLLVAVLSPAGAVIGQIGDGAVVIDGAGEGWRPVHWPDHGEYANTTSFLTQPEALEGLRIEIVDRPVRRMVVFSDGLERLVLDFKNRTAYGPFFDSLLGRLEAAGSNGKSEAVSNEIAALLGSDKVNSRTDDDKSLLCVAWRD